MLSFLKSASLLFIAGTSSQAITFVVAIFLARLIEPEALGGYGTFQAVALTLTPLVLLGLNYGIPLAKIKSTPFLIFVLISIFSILFYLTSTFLGAALFYAGLLDISLMIIFLLPFFTIVSAGHQLVHANLVREKAFSVLAVFMILSALSIGLGKISAAFFFGSADSLLLGHAFALLIIVISTFMYSIHCGWIKALVPKINKLIKVLKLNSQFIKYKVPVDISSAAIQAVPLILLTSLVGAAVTGWYVLAKSLLIAPSRLISKSLTDSTLAEQIKLLNQRDIKAKTLFLKTSLMLMLVSLCLFLPVAIWGPQLFSLFFGEEWNEAGMIASLICFWLACSFVSKPALMLVGRLRLTKIDMYLEFGFSILKLIVFYFYLTITKDYLLAIGLFSILSGLRYLTITTLVYRKITSFTGTH